MEARPVKTDDELARLVIDHMAARGMLGTPGAGGLIIAYVEGMDLDGALNDDAIDGWNDLRLVLAPDPPRLLFKCQATTEPGTYYDRDHVIGSGPRGRGAALIALGKQSCWQVGNHRSNPDHEALVQSGAEVTVYRDYDRSFRRQEGSTDTGWFGINQHGPGAIDGSETSIGPHSAGCLVARRMADHRAFMALVKTDPRYVADHRHVFDTTVISGRELLGLAQDGPRPGAQGVPLAPADPGATQVPATAQTAPAAAGRIVDTPVDVTPHLAALRSAGVGSVIRYLTTSTSSAKLVRPAEARAIAAAGMQLGLVFEVYGGVDNFRHGDITAASGAAHADFAVRYAPTVGAPPGCGIYFAIDTDASPDELERFVVPYFRAVHQAIAGPYRVGVYCSGLVAERLRQLQLVDLVWITCSSGFRGSRDYVAAGKQDLWQSKCDTTLAGIDVDLDVANRADWGQFVPFATAAILPGPVPLPTAAWPTAWGPREGDATWYSDGSNADGSPVDNRTDLSCATQNRSIPFGTRLKVTRTDTGASVVVTVRDRGGSALTGPRIIDLRPAARDALDMREVGIAPVRLDLVTAAASKPPPSPPQPPGPAQDPEVERKLAAITAAIRPILQEKPHMTPDPQPDILKVLAGIAQVVKDLQEGKTTPTPTAPPLELSIIDQIFGGKTLAGKKTVIGVLGVAGTLLSALVPGMPLLDVAGAAFPTLLTLFGGTGVLGIAAKIDRGVKIAAKIAQTLQAIHAAQPPAAGSSTTGLPTIWTPGQ
jgi:hypothetical protein